MAGEKFVPQYKRIYQDLRRSIEEGKYKPGARLPFEKELCALYSVERITVRSALKLLAEDGLIVKKPGVGSFVRGTERKYEADAPGSYTALFLMGKREDYIQSSSAGFNALLFFPMEQLCRENGCTLLFRSCIEGDNVADIVNQSRAQFVFMVSTMPEHFYDEIYKLGIPALCLNHYDKRFVSVMPDSMRSIREVISYLVSLGHRNIAFLNGLPAASNAIERMHAFRCAMRDEGMNVNEAWVSEDNWTYASGRERMKKLLNAGGALPTAVVAGNDMIAIGCMEALREKGLSVPGDISVVGFDDINTSRFCTPLLTTVNAQPLTMARIAVRQMLDILDPATPVIPCAVYSPACLTLRDSVSVPSR